MPLLTLGIMLLEALYVNIYFPAIFLPYMADHHTLLILDYTLDYIA